MKLKPELSALKTGVYCIRNKVNGKVYVGSSASNIHTRFRAHRISLRGNRHDNKNLQMEWNEFGETAFEFSIICTCSPEWCLTMEQIHVDRTGCCDPSIGYNRARRVSNSSGWKHSEETKTRMREVAKNKKMPADFLKRCSERMKALAKDPGFREKANEGVRKYWSEPHPEHTAARLAACHSPTARKKISEFHKGRKFSPEHISKLKKARAKMVLSEEARKRMSEAQKRRYQNQAERDKLRAFGEKGRSDRKRMSENGRRRWDSLKKCPITGKILKQSNG